MHFPQIHGSPLRQRLSLWGSLWQAGSLSTRRLRLDRTQEGGPCLRGQRLLDNAPCQAVAGPDSGALLLPRYCASLVQTKAGRHANGSPFGGAGEEQGDETERARLLTENHRHCDSIALTKSLPIAAQWLFPAGLALSVIASQCHLSQRERLWQAASFPVSFWRKEWYNGFAALPAHLFGRGGETNA